MDKLIQCFDSVPDSDLQICPHHGVAYQSDMRVGRVEYDATYLNKCWAYEGSEIAKRVNDGRCALLMRHLPDDTSVLDIGAGTGAFVLNAIRWGFEAKGFDVIPDVAELLRRDNLYDENISHFDAVTLWDVIEHIEEPEICLGAIREGGHLFVSVPIFDDLRNIRASKHYRPGEHLYYWTEKGFVDWMSLYGFQLLEKSTHETDAGRDSIGAFAFRRDSPIA